MSDPLALLPLALAGGKGRLNDHEAQQLVAAGLTLLQRSAPLVRALAGRRAAILLPPSSAFLTALAASEGRGAVLINPLAASREIEFQCRDAAVGALFTIASHAARLPSALAAALPVVLLDDAPRSARVVADGIVRSVDLGSHHGLSLEGERDVPGRDEEAAIVYTSAMHGVPLGAMLTHRNLLANARATVEAVGNAADDHVLALLPFAHLFGLIVAGAGPLLAGARVTTMARFHPARAIELLREGITELVAVPSVYHALLRILHHEGETLVGSALRVCVCGGAALPVELQERWFHATGVELRQGYGLTEAGPVCLFNRVDRPNVRGTLGVAYPGVEVEIRPSGGGGAGARGDALAEGTAGEICVRGPNVFRGYLHDGDAGLLVHDGWLHTGDLGRRNADGTVSFLGLLKPMFTRNGFNVYPREVERAVLELPGVTEVEARSRVDPVREHDLVLRVRGNVTEEEVRRWCGERLSAYKHPSAIELAPG